MNALYFATRFRTEEGVEDWPDEFAIITAFATTGESWTAEKNQSEDARLKEELEERKLWHRRITGFNSESGHAEPGWAVALDLQTACRLGEAFRQDAIYFVSHGLLAICPCKDGRRHLAPVGRFNSRVIVEPPASAADAPEAPAPPEPGPAGPLRSS